MTNKKIFFRISELLSESIALSEHLQHTYVCCCCFFIQITELKKNYPRIIIQFSTLRKTLNVKMFIQNINLIWVCTVMGNGYPFKGDNSGNLFYPPSEKGVYSERKEFAPKRSKFFPFRVDPFSEGIK